MSTATKIVSINLDSVRKQLSNIVGTSVNTKDSIYVYPNNLTAIDISGKKGKSFRVKMRKNFEDIVNAFTIVKKQKETKAISEKDFTENCKQLKDLFVKIYKENYRVNDFSLASVTQSNNEGKKAEILNFLNFCKASKIATKTNVAKKVSPTKKESKETVKESTK